MGDGGGKLIRGAPLHGCVPPPPPRPSADAEDYDHDTTQTVGQPVPLRAGLAPHDTERFLLPSQ